VQWADEVNITDVFNVRHLHSFHGDNPSLRSSFQEEYDARLEPSQAIVADGEQEEHTTDHGIQSQLPVRPIITKQYQRCHK
jgi:hypothetical protein